MTAQRLTLACWLSITYAVLTIPYLLIGVFLVKFRFFLVKSGGGLKQVYLLLMLVTLVLCIFVLSSLKKLLNTRFSFRDTDIFIDILILLNIASTVISVFSTLFPALKSEEAVVSGVLFLAMGITYGIVYVVFAIKLLRLQETMYGMLKPFAYTTMVEGICYASIVLVPIALIASIVSCVILGNIFMRAAESSY